MWLEVDDVVSESLAEIARGKVIIIPSVQYKAIVTAGRLVPRNLLRAFGRRVGGAVAEPDSDRQELAELVRRLSLVHGRVTLSSGKEADYYVDLRRATLHHRASALIGRLMRELTRRLGLRRRRRPDPGRRSGGDRDHARARPPDRRVRRSKVRENPWPATSYRGFRGLRPAGAGGGGHQQHGRFGADRGACRPRRGRGGRRCGHRGGPRHRRGGGHRRPTGCHTGACWVWPIWDWVRPLSGSLCARSSR